MRDMDELPPDQRAVLALVLTQQRSYDEVASMLGIPEQSVRERAHAALDALATQAASSPASAQSSRNGSDHDEPRPNTPYGASAAGNTAALAQIQTRPTATAPNSIASTKPGTALGNGASPPARSAGTQRSSSRLGGAILLGAIVVGVVVAAIVLSGGSKGSSTHSGKATAAKSGQGGTGSGGTGSAGASSSGVRLDSRFSLSSPDPSVNASGQGLVVSQGKARAFYVTARGLPPSSGFFYAVWLYNSQSDSYPLGRTNVSSNGRLEGGGPLTTPHLASFHKLVITRETSEHPAAPGPIVLSGPFSLR
jgi:hypothetical protein